MLLKRIKWYCKCWSSNLAAKRYFIKVQVEKLNINKLVNAPTSLNNLKTKVDVLDVDKLKTAAVDLKKLKDVVNKGVAKNTTN